MQNTGHVGGEHSSTSGTAGEAAVTATERWGDYSTTDVDPRNGRDFWTVQIYATAQNTWWASIPPTAGRRRAVRK